MNKNEYCIIREFLEYIGMNMSMFRSCSPMLQGALLRTYVRKIDDKDIDKMMMMNEEDLV